MRKLHSKRRYPCLIFIFSIMVLTSCEEQIPTDLTQVPIIPKPIETSASGDSYRIREKTAICYPSESKELEALGYYLSDALQQITGWQLKVMPVSGVPRRGKIFLELSPDDASIGAEGYHLTITRKLVQITANQSAGIFNGIQTLRQLLPVHWMSGDESGNPLILATGVIRDYPQYAWRGAMLDVARHFFGVEDVKRFIDLMAVYKMNVLHLHLADDQGWRIEIKSWPNLAKHGGSTEVGGGPGGYFTQDRYKEIVDYARLRNILIVPEIDMPGHTNAALASYAELNCNGKATSLYTGTRVGFSTLCTNKEITYQFIDDVVRELSELTPGPYIHIGGDESHVTTEEDYIPFINRVQEIVEAHGKMVIGWDDISIASLSSQTVAQHWANVKNANRAAGQGAKLILSPASRAYLDMKYDSTTTLGLNWAGYVEVDQAYNWNPSTLIEGITEESILGIEAPLWSETVTNMAEIEYMIFPRLPGFAEIGWTAAAERSWEEYKTRLAAHGLRFKEMKINFYPSPLVPWPDLQ